MPAVEKRTDPRVRRTRAALRAALLRLAREVPLTELSVARVAAEADVSRQTFYAHHGDLDELAVDALRDEFDQLRTISRETGELAGDGEDPMAAPPGLVRLAGFLHDHRALLAAVLGPDGSPRFAHWLRQLVAADVAEGLRQRPERVHADVPLEVQARFVAGGVLETLLLATAGPGSRDPDALAEQLWALLRHLFDIDHDNREARP
jgi:AcrR family transcriptional regulator